MKATTQNFRDQPESIFTDQSRQVDILFWVLVFTLYFIDFMDSRGKAHGGNDLYALDLAILNVALGIVVAYSHYWLVQLLLEKKVLPKPAIGREKIEIHHKGKIIEKSYPIFYKRKEYPLNVIFPIYFIFTMLLVVVNTLLYKFCGDWIELNVLKPEDFKAFSYTANVPEAMTIMFLFTGIMYALRFHRQHIETNVERKRNELEIEALRWQLKPHFLLGSLSSLYNAVDNSDKKVGLKIAKLLSDMTRYVVDEASYYKPKVANDETNKKRIINSVPISKEIKFINNFIELKQFEKDHDDDLIVFNTESLSKEYLITPMILICYVENAFKHGLDNDRQKRAIKIDLKMQGDTLSFNVFNYKPAASTHILFNNPDILKQLEGDKIEKRTTNAGMVATAKLLEAAYPHGQHKLTVTDTDDIFEIQLNIYKLNKAKI
jgi:two-component system, LytTR family, sensor kinase